MKKIIVFFIFLLTAASYGFCNESLSKELYVYNWKDYFAPDTIKNFEERFGVKVHLETFDSEEELIATLESYPEKYDVVIGSGNVTRGFIKKRLLLAINKKNIPNLSLMDPKFLGLDHDEKNEYSIPYLWGTTGIVVNRKFISEDNSWEILWNPKYQGKIAMLSGMDEVFGAVLKSLGFSCNTLNFAELKKAKGKMLAQKNLLAGYFETIALRDKMIKEELWAAHIYSGEGLFAMNENKNLEYFIPKEGAVIWVDSLMIPRDAPHPHTAEVFINYILEPQVSADIANYLWYANCNIAARALMQKEILESPALYPSEDILKQCEFLESSKIEDQFPGVRMFWKEAISVLQLNENNRNEGMK
ncbi:MAG TPA: spermidine/putrescine ABC transporter substrate-binding protein [Candidatus Omnitrophota bacterium]|nr:spermidine/putrescine ABC transporter substrate-binding protein [Candidatus Omnitrophota bacterium]HPN89053.1 spermidine/putrescine ABC transporter substrate-binding protein [Candidatus Omnitrophota bacterium]